MELANSQYTTLPWAYPSRLNNPGAIDGNISKVYYSHRTPIHDINKHMLNPPKKNRYIEIAEQFLEQVVEGRLSPGDKIASVRETAIRMGVTPNTAANAHAHLRDLGIIRPLLGKGSVVTHDAPSICRAYIETLFIEHEIPIIRQRVSLLGLSEQQILELLKDEEAHEEKG